MTADAVAESKITVPELPTAFVSREHLLDPLDPLDPLDQAGPGQLVVVIAPPGVRKDDAVVVLGAQAGRRAPRGWPRTCASPTRTPRSSSTPPV